MSVADDMTRIAAQEAALVFDRFDEASAFAIGTSLKALAEARKQTLAIDVRFWDRQLFFFSMPGIPADNTEWIRRKSNCVKRFGRPSYLFTLRLKEKGGAFPFDSAVDQADVAAHGGSFPIRIAGTGIVGSITVSGVPGRDDHGFVVTAIAKYLGIDAAPLMLPAE